MSFLRHFKRMQYIDFMIRRKATGTPEAFAHKNRLSKSGLMLVIRDMRDVGFPIKYNRDINSYYYEHEGEIVKTLFIDRSIVLPAEELRHIGKNICFSAKDIFEQC